METNGFIIKPKCCLKLYNGETTMKENNHLVLFNHCEIFHHLLMFNHLCLPVCFLSSRRGHRSSLIIVTKNVHFQAFITRSGLITEDMSASVPLHVTAYTFPIWLNGTRAILLIVLWWPGRQPLIMTPLFIFITQAWGLQKPGHVIAVWNQEMWKIGGEMSKLQQPSFFMWVSIMCDRLWSQSKTEVSES